MTLSPKVFTANFPSNISVLKYTSLPFYEHIAIQCKRPRKNVRRKKNRKGLQNWGKGMGKKRKVKNMTDSAFSHFPMTNSSTGRPGFLRDEEWDWRQTLWQAKENMYPIYETNKQKHVKLRQKAIKKSIASGTLSSIIIIGTCVCAWYTCHQYAHLTPLIQ